MKSAERVILGLLLASISLPAAELSNTANTTGTVRMTSVAAPPFAQPLQINEIPTIVTNGVGYPDAHHWPGIVSREIKLTETGCEATYGRHKVSFNADLASSEAPISVTMPDGKKLAFRPSYIVLANRITGQNLLIAEVTNRTGQIIQPDIVLWTNAFDASGPMLDVEYRYSSRGSLEQNIIFRQNPLKNLPGDWKIADVSVECWTEMHLDSPPSSVQSQSAELRPASGSVSVVDAEDQTISWDSMKIVAGGRAFSIGGEQDPTPVSKIWTQVNDGTRTRTFLIESLDALAAKPRFDALPTVRQALNKRPNSNRTEMLRMRASVRRNKEREEALMIPKGRSTSFKLIAANSLPSAPGVVLDFSIINTVPVPSGNVSWWPAGGNALDANVNHNDGTVYGSIAYTAGKVGEAFNFTASDAYVQIPDGATLNPTNALTIDGWVYFYGGTSNYMIVGKDDQDTQRQFLLGVSSAGKFRSYIGITNGTFYYIEGSTIVTTSTWYHVAMTYSAANSNLSLYVNGALDTNGTVSGSTIRSTEPVFIGNQPYSISYNAGILVDEVDLFNRALAGAEIQSIYNAGAAGKVNPNCAAPSTNAIGWWGGDDSIYDLAHTNSGIFFNGASYASGKVGDGFSFDGVNDYLVVSNNAIASDLNPTNAITLEAWVYLNSFDNLHHPIISKDGCDHDRQYLLTVNDSQTFRFHIGTSCGFCFSDGTNVVPVGAWTHVAMTYDSATEKLILYVNGAPDTEVTDIAGPIISTPQPIFIGGAPHPCFPYYFPGIIDEPTIYNRALTATEISAIYSAGCAGKCKVDSDSDGLTDLQETWVGTDPNNADTDGDGRTDGDEVFVYPSDPKDYYNGNLPVLTIVSGNNQSGLAGTFLPLPLRVSVNSTNGVILTNAPVSFAVSQGGAQLAAVAYGTTSTSLNTRTDTNGLAQAALLLPSSGVTNYITATAKSGTNTVQVTFTALILDGPKLWLRADAGVTTNASNQISVWVDQSGNSNGATQNNVNLQPFFVNGAVNGRPTVRFYGSNYFPMPFFLNATTGAEALVVLKATADAPSGGQQLWRWGGSGSGGLAYPDSGGNILDDFGSTVVRGIGNPAQPLDQYHLYNVAGQANFWSAWVNGILQASTTNNNYGAWSDPKLGFANNAYFSGDIAEVLIFARVLSSAERDTISGYLNGKYAMVASAPVAPTSLVASAISASQVSLSWNFSLGNASTTFKIERKTGVGGAYAQLAAVRDATSWVDTGLAANTQYYYRVKASNFAGDSAYSSEASATTFASGADLPLSDLRLWLKADAGAVQRNTNKTVGVWFDQSGNNSDAIQFNSTQQPFWVDGTINGKPVVRFYGSNYFPLTYFLGATTGAEAMVVLKAAADMPSAQQQLWRIGGGGQGGLAYPDAAGTIWDDFGSSAQRQVGNPAAPLDQYHLYNIAGQLGLWSAWINGVLQQNTTNNGYGVWPSPTLGYANNAYFSGDIAEILVFGRVLTSGERDTVSSYLNGKYAILASPPQAPTNLSATAVSPTQVSLMWGFGFGNFSTLFKVERKAGVGGTYAQIASVRDATSWVDTNLTASTQYYYRVKASNLAGDSGYSNETNTTTLASGPDLPISDLRLWLKADAGVVRQNTNNTVETWFDQSGNLNDANQYNSTQQPFWVDCALNGRPVLRFYGSNYFPLPIFLNATTGAEAFVMLKAAVDAPSGRPQLWRLGYSLSGALAYPDNGGNIVDDFGSTTVWTINNPLPRLDEYHLYNVASQDGFWSAWINRMLQLSATNNNYAVWIDPKLGFANNAYFSGDIAEILIFSRVLSTAERDAVGRYLYLKYNFIANPSLLVTAIDSSNLLLSWTNGASQSSVSGSISRKIGPTGSYAQIAQIQPTTFSLTDTNTSPVVNYYYQVAITNTFGGVNFAEASPPTIVITNPSPGAAFVTPGNVGVGVSAADSDGTVAQVQVFRDKTLLETLSSSPYTFIFTNLSLGSLVLSAKAIDNSGNLRISDTVVGTIKPDTDGDGLSDDYEIAIGTNPTLPDTDGDGVPDGQDAFPLDPTRWSIPASDPNDHTAPTIFIDEPLGATLVP